MKIGEGVTGWVAEHQASVVADLEMPRQDSRFKIFPALVEDTYEAFLSVPADQRGQVIGVINVHHRERHAHTAEEIRRMLVFMGEQMGGAIAKSAAGGRERAADGGDRRGHSGNWKPARWWSAPRASCSAARV